jgi:hypothetical protein
MSYDFPMENACFFIGVSTAFSKIVSLANCVGCLPSYFCATGGNVTKGVHQPSLPGIDVGAIALDGLVKSNPRPTNVAEADRFLRRYTVTTIVKRTDHDYMRIVFKGTDASEHKEKHEYSTELDIFDAALRDKEFIRYTQKMYDIWLENQKTKYA